MEWKKLLTQLLISSATLAESLNFPELHSGVSICERRLIPPRRLGVNGRSSASNGAGTK